MHSELSEEKEGFLSANDNCWYRLMTIFGEHNNSIVDENLHKKNTMAWHYWMARLTLGSRYSDLSENEFINKLSDFGWSSKSIDQLSKIDSSQIREIEKSTSLRLPHSDFGEFWQTIRSTKDVGNIIIDLNNYEFDNLIVADDFVFPFTFNCSSAAFNQVARFCNSLWLDEASFDLSSFNMMARFDNAVFSNNAYFNDANFRVWVYFRNTKFKRFAMFHRCKFEQFSDFDKACFNQQAHFEKSSCGTEFLFTETTCNQDIIFSNATFLGKANFAGSDFQQGLWGSSVSWLGDVPNFIGAKVEEKLSLDGVKWPELSHFDRKKADIAMGYYSALCALLKKCNNWRDYNSAYEQEMRAYQVNLQGALSEKFSFDTWFRVQGLKFYGKVSKYGTDIGTPLVMIFVFLLAFFFFHGFGLSLYYQLNADSPSNYLNVAEQAFNLSIYGSWPLSFWPLDIQNYSSLHLAILFIHSIISTLLWFLIVLGLLNAKTNR